MKRFDQKACRGLPRAGVMAMLLGVVAAPVVLAFHFPWDQGHDTFTPNPPPPPPPPPPPDGGGDGDPVELPAGNFFFNRTRHDLRFLDQGPAVELLFAYHSRDEYCGPFGYGWHTTLTSLAIQVTDGIARSVVIRDGMGRRKRFALNPDGTFVPPLGIYERLVQNADETYTLFYRGGLRHEYTRDGRLLGIVAVGGQAIQVVYDANGAITSVRSAGGKILTFAQGASGLIETVQDPVVGTYGFEYDTGGNLVKATDPLGNVTQYAYATSGDTHNLTRVTAPNGVIEITNAYDTSDRVSSHALRQATLTFTYTSATEIRVSDAVRGTTIHRFNADGRPTSVTSGGQTRSWVWDAQRNLVQATDATGGNVTSYEYDDAGNIVKVTKDGAISRLTYDTTHNRVISILSEASGKTAAIGYDDAAGTVQITDVAGGTWTVKGEAYGLLESGRRALGYHFPYTARYQLSE